MEFGIIFFFFFVLANELKYARVNSLELNSDIYYARVNSLEFIIFFFLFFILFFSSTEWWSSVLKGGVCLDWKISRDDISA